MFLKQNLFSCKAAETIPHPPNMKKFTQHCKFGSTIGTGVYKSNLLIFSPRMVTYIGYSKRV